MRTVRASIGGLGNLLFKQAYLIGQVLNGKIPDVYVQGKKYWATHADEIRSYFSEGIGRTDKVALHIRRGDYLKADNFHVNLWNTEYYKQALRLFPNEKFLVFCRDRQSDEQDAADRKWCEENLPALIGEFEFADGKTEVDDLNLMASCKGIIMANSSFSWWAAFLNPNKDKRITCPRQWFVDGNQRTELLDEWILI